MSCLFDPIGCAQATFWNAVNGVAWYWWALLVIVLLAAAWRFAGIPGLVAAAAGIGFLFGRFRPPAARDVQRPTAPRPSGVPNIDRKPNRPTKKVSDFWRKYNE